MTYLLIKTPSRSCRNRVISPDRRSFVILMISSAKVFYMKQLLLAFVVLLLPRPANAQLSETEKVKKSLTAENKDTVAWLHNGALNLGLNEGFLHNWAAGGEVASLTVDGLFSGSLTRLYHNHVWTNNLELAYSLFYAYSNHFVPRKVDDRIDFT